MLSAISLGVFCRRAPFNHLDHPVQKRIARFRRDAHDDLVADDPRAAGDGAAVAAAFADDRRRLARDGRFVHGGDAFDDLAIGGDELARFADEAVADFQFVGVDGEVPCR